MGRIVAARMALGSLMTLAMCPIPAWGQAEGRHRIRPEHELNSYGVVESVPGMVRVRLVPDVTYKTVAGQALHMDFYDPPDPPTQAGARPATR